MDMEYTLGLMEANMKDFGRIIKLMGLENLNIVMEMYLKENGLMIWPMVLEGIFILKELFMKVYGRMIIRMDLEVRNGLMVVYLRVII
jgi:hypothetical protein